MSTITTLFNQDSVPPLGYIRLRILRDQAAVTYFFPVAAALALCLVLWEESPRTRLTPWLILVLAHAAFRYWSLMRAHARHV